jgi:hypothetical protein
VPGGDQAATAVATWPGQDRHRAGRKADDCQFGQATSGVLHHLDEFDVQIFDHRPVDCAHLLGGQRRDCGPAHSTHRFSSGLSPLGIQSGRVPPTDAWLWRFAIGTLVARRRARDLASQTIPSGLLERPAAGDPLENAVRDERHRAPA